LSSAASRAALSWKPARAARRFQKGLFMITDEQKAARTKRLEALEDGIRRGLIAQHRAALVLKKIRDEELYKEDGYASWKDYLKAKDEWTEREADRMIREAVHFFSMVDATKGVPAAEAKV
jgi:hypothetical protein